MSRSIAALIDVVRSEPAGALPQERSTPRKILYWGATGLVATDAAAGRVLLSDHRPPGGRELPARGISPAVACPARHREAVRSHRAAPATAADVEGMGLRRLYLHVDRGNRGALSGRRRALVLAARRVDRVAGGFVRHASGESPRFRGGDAVVARTRRRIARAQGGHLEICSNRRRSLRDRCGRAISTRAAIGRSRQCQRARHGPVWRRRDGRAGHCPSDANKPDDDHDHRSGRTLSAPVPSCRPVRNHGAAVRVSRTPCVT